MKTYIARTALPGALFALALLSACDKTPSAPSAASPASAAMPEVTPHSGSLPASSAAGPAEGTTAIGGMVGGQGSGGALGGKTPAPTAGDGAASQAPK